MVGLTGLEPVTLRLSSVCSNQLSYRPFFALLLSAGGAEEIRTPDILLAKQTLYQLSYSPKPFSPGSLNSELCDKQTFQSFQIGRPKTFSFECLFSLERR